MGQRSQGKAVDAPADRDCHRPQRLQALDQLLLLRCGLLGLPVVNFIRSCHGREGQLCAGLGRYTSLAQIPKLGNRPRPRRRARPLAAHNADNPAGGSPAMVNDDKPSSYNRRG
jgi:hypothetical protein